MHRHDKSCESNSVPGCFMSSIDFKVFSNRSQISIMSGLPFSFHSPVSILGLDSSRFFFDVMKQLPIVWILMVLVLACYYKHLMPSGIPGLHQCQVTQPTLKAVYSSLPKKTRRMLIVTAFPDPDHWGLFICLQTRLTSLLSGYYISHVQLVSWLITRNSP